MAAPVCFARVATATATPDAPGRRRAPSRTAAVIAGSMKTSKFAACPSWGANATEARTNSNPATQRGAIPVAPPRLEREQQSRDRDRRASRRTRTDHSAVLPTTLKVAA